MLIKENDTITIHVGDKSYKVNVEFQDKWNTNGYCLLGRDYGENSRTRFKLYRFTDVTCMGTIIRAKKKSLAF